MSKHTLRASAVAAGTLLAVAALAVGSSAALIAHGEGTKPHVATAHAALTGTEANGGSGSAGANGGAATDQQAGTAILGVSVQQSNGALQVAAVVTGGPADKAGIKQGDTISSVEGTAVTTADDLKQALSAKKPRDAVTVSIMRAGAAQSVTITLGSAPQRRGNGGNTTPDSDSASDGHGGAGMPGLPEFSAVLGQNFDRFISSEVKTKDAGGSTHTDTSVGGVVKGSPTSSQVTVTLNGGGEKSFTIDSNTKMNKGRGGSQASALAQDDKVLVTTRDGSNSAVSILVVKANGGPGSFFGKGGSANSPANGNGPKKGQTPAPGGTPGAASTSGSQNGPQGGQIHIRIPAGQNITVPGTGDSNKPSPDKSNRPTF